MLSTKQAKQILKEGKTLSIIHTFNNDFEGGSGRIQGEIKKFSSHRKPGVAATYKVTFVNGIEKTFYSWGSVFVNRALPYENVTW